MMNFNKFSTCSGLLTTFGGSQEVFPAGFAACGCKARRKKDASRRRRLCLHLFPFTALRRRRLRTSGGCFTRRSRFGRLLAYFGTRRGNFNNNLFRVRYPPKDS